MALTDHPDVAADARPEPTADQLVKRAERIAATLVTIAEVAMIHGRFGIGPERLEGPSSPCCGPVAEE